MNDILTKLKEIAEQLTEKSRMFTKDIPAPNFLMEHLYYLNAIKSEVNELKPELQYQYDRKLADVTSEILTREKDNIKGNAAMIKNMIQGEMALEQRVLNFCDRINSTIERESENLRSILSSMKQGL